MAAYEVLLLNTAIPQIQAAQSGDTYLCPRELAVVVNTATDAVRITQTGTGNALLVEDSTNPDSTPFVVTAAGNVGIGTDTPGVKLDTVGVMRSTFNSQSNGGPTLHGLELRQSTTSTKALVAGYSTSGTQTGAYIQAVNFGTAYEDLVLQPQGGNLGLGVTPSAWGSGFTALEVGRAGSGFFSVGTDSLQVTNNYYYNGTNYIYAANGYAERYHMVTGQHQWYTAPSGTANTTTITNGVSYTIITSGNQTAFGAANNNVGTSFTATSSGTLSSGTVSQNISFTQAMTLDASGNLVVGATVAEARIQATALNPTNGVTAFFQNLSTSAQTGSKIRLEVGNVGQAGLGIPDGSTNALAFFVGGMTSASERARITSGGDFQVSSGGSVQVGGTAARATTAGTNRLDIFNGTAPVGTLTDGISIYSSSGEAYVMDAAGNATLFSPHDAETNEWIFKSKHTPTGKVLKIDVERLLKFVNDHFGLDAVHEFVEE